MHIHFPADMNSEGQSKEGQQYWCPIHISAAVWRCLFWAGDQYGLVSDPKI
jgi:hypothetical protein